MWAVPKFPIDLTAFLYPDTLEDPVSPSYCGFTADSPCILVKMGVYTHAVQDHLSYQELVVANVFSKG